MKENNQLYLGTEKISKLMGKYAIPCIISLLVGALYNIVDQIFIANAAYLGSYGNAANTVVFPLTVIAATGLVPLLVFRWGQVKRKMHIRVSGMQFYSVFLVVLYWPPFILFLVNRY